MPMLFQKYTTKGLDGSVLKVLQDFFVSFAFQSCLVVLLPSFHNEFVCYSLSLLDLQEFMVATANADDYHVPNHISVIK